MIRLTPKTKLYKDENNVLCGKTVYDIRLEDVTYENLDKKLAELKQIILGSLVHTEKVNG